MPYDVPLPHGIRALWKAKILDREVPREEPHVTIICKTRRWRYAIRMPAFLDDDPSPRDVPDAVLAAIAADHESIVAAWNVRHPHNPV